ncbi:retrovirus-related pol polyprotein from transposon TNT 1-94 [Tanacetum coccineum]
MQHLFIINTITLQSIHNNNQFLHNHSYLRRNQATIQDGRVTVQQIQGRQTQSFTGIGNRGIATTSRGDYAASQPKVMKCYNCQGEGHMARHYTQPKRPRNVAWFKEKLMLAKAHEATFQTEDLDAYDSYCDDLSLAKAVLMVNLSSCDSDVLFEQEIDTLKETLSNHVKEKESLSKTLTVFKTESKEKESKYIDKEIVLEKQNKELENIICKMYRSTQAMHMLTKPQVFYDDTHKQALGYQNPFHLKKVQRIQPTLYDGNVIAKEHAVIFVIDDEETLILEEENFGKRFVTQQELSAEQAFWLKHLSFSETPVKSHTPVRIEAPSELPKIFANAALKNKLRKLKGKNVVDTAVSKPNATIALGMFKLDIEPVSPRLKNNRDAHEVYIKKTIEYTDTLRGFVERSRT